MVTVQVQLIRMLMETVYWMFSYRTEKVVSSHWRFTLPNKTKLKTITGLGLTYWPEWCSCTWSTHNSDYKCGYPLINTGYRWRVGIFMSNGTCSPFWTGTVCRSIYYRCMDRRWKVNKSIRFWKGCKPTDSYKTPKHNVIVYFMVCRKKWRKK